MKKENILSLIKYHVDGNNKAFREEAMNVARYFDSIGDYQLSEYIMNLFYTYNGLEPQDQKIKTIFLKEISIENLAFIDLPKSIADDVLGVINSIHHNMNVNKFLFYGMPGSGKTEAAKQIARILKRKLYGVDFNSLVDSKLGQTNKNISLLFDEISQVSQKEEIVVLFDEIDVIALDRINANDVREMGRVTSAILKELDQLSQNNSNVVLIATTNLYNNLDKALLRRFDFAISFDRYTNSDLIEIAEHYFAEISKKAKHITKDTRLFKKILMNLKKMPYPGDLKNIIKTSIAFSSPDDGYDYLKRLYSSLICPIKNKTLVELYDEGFTLREIEALKGESKSSVARKINREYLINE
ncbi:AAA family ATPase [Mycoplasma sp. VS292A]|uniref:AAA family ATPase n=1 Tax=unclassified Mycoplasma TaxID=2683645 RepID=UPI003AAAB3F2